MRTFIVLIKAAEKAKKAVSRWSDYEGYKRGPYKPTSKSRVKVERLGHTSNCFG